MNNTDQHLDSTCSSDLSRHVQSNFDFTKSHKTRNNGLNMPKQHLQTHLGCDIALKLTSLSNDSKQFSLAMWQTSPTVLFAAFLYVLQSAFVTRLNYPLHHNIVLRFHTTYISDIQHTFEAKQTHKSRDTSDYTQPAATRARCLETGPSLLSQPAPPQRERGA